MCGHFICSIIIFEASVDCYSQLPFTTTVLVFVGRLTILLVFPIEVRSV
jgi:hypothetical protein